MVANGHHQLVTPFITNMRTHTHPTSVDDPLSTVATGNHHYLTTPAFYIKNYGGNARPEHLAKPLTDPLGTVTAIDHHALVIPYRRAQAKRVTEPFHTIATRVGEALVQPLSIEVDDCFYRMLKPREHLRAQRFVDSYIVTGNIGEQTMQAGNAVPVNVAQWVGERLLQVLG